MSYDIQKVKQAFQANPELFIQHFFHHAKHKSGNYVMGDISGSEGESLVMSVKGRAGSYIDWANPSDAGDFIDLLMQNKGIELSEALEQIASLYNVQKEHDLTVKRKPIQPIKPITRAVAVDDTSKVQKYLIEERGIRKETLDAYQIGTTKTDFIVFPHINPQGEVIQRAYVSLVRNEKGKKDVKQDKGAQHYCFGLHLLDNKSRQIVITEGQIDCMTLYQSGIKNVISIPMGVGKPEFIDVHWDLFAKFDDIVICFDMDEKGQSFAVDVAKRLGVERCRIASFDDKDVNDCWNNGYDDPDLHEIIKNAKHIENERVYALGSDIAKTEKFIASQEENSGDPFFIPELEFNQRMGEFTVWTGYSGCGKTTILNQQMINLLCRNPTYKIFYASFEQNTHQLELLFSRQLSGNAYKSSVSSVFSILESRVYDYIPSKNKSISELFETMLYCIKRYGCNIFIIDNLVTCGIPEGDNDAQTKFINELNDFCNEHYVGVHLVAHSRKSDKDDNETKIPSKHSVRGSSSITDIPDNGLTIWRNPGIELTDMECDGVIKIWKQRENGIYRTAKYQFNSAYRCATLNKDKHYDPPIKV